MVKIWEMTNRLRKINKTRSGTLLYLSRPNPIFKRHLYDISGFTPQNEDTRQGIEAYGGDEWKLDRIELQVGIKRARRIV